MMKRILVLLLMLCGLWVPSSVTAQRGYDLGAVVDDVRGDSLPDNMPPIKALLWGERGAVRAMNLGPTYRSEELALRRKMLSVHQKMAFATLGLFTAEVVMGNMMYRDPARYYDALQPWHRGMAYATFGSYVATASLSITAPPGRRYQDRFDSTKLHRYLSVIHFSGMMAQPILGRRLAAAEGDEYDRLNRIHRANGMITYAAYVAAMFAFVIDI
jgi:hypothetical protein